jgi:transposase InsO family protein
MEQSSDSFADRSLRALGKRQWPGRALRAVLKAQRLLGLAIGLEIAERRYTPEPLPRAVADAKLSDCLLRAYQEVCRILGEHLDKVHESRRPHYSPEQRYRILRVKSLLGSSREEAADLFRVSASTIARWEQESLEDPEREFVGALVKPEPPVRRYADVVRELVRTLAVCGFGGNQRIAQTLARAGWKLGRETVRRMRQERPLSTAGEELSESCARSVRARFPHHVWMVDLTEIPARFRLFSFKLVAVLDVFSRVPPVWKVFLREPSALRIRRLLSLGIRRYGLPRHLVSDQGPQFTERRLREWLQRKGIRQRFGAVGKTGSIALIERFWRSVKQLLAVPFYQPLLPGELSSRLNRVLTYYTEIRPHQGLAGATPAEVFARLLPAHLAASSPPRGRAGERSPPAPFRIRYFRGDPRLPCLVRTSAA